MFPSIKTGVHLPMYIGPYLLTLHLFCYETVPICVLGTLVSVPVYWVSLGYLQNTYWLRVLTSP